MSMIRAQSIRPPRQTDARAAACPQLLQRRIMLDAKAAHLPRLDTGHESTPHVFDTFRYIETLDLRSTRQPLERLHLVRWCTIEDRRREIGDCSNVPRGRVRRH
jgi:hypothetical protein